MDTDVAGQLQAILIAHGTDLATDPGALGELLAESCPDQPQEVGLLLAAADQGAAGALLDRTGLPLDDQIAELAQNLADSANLEATSAEWAVQAWAFALGSGAPSPGPLSRPGRAAGASRRGLLVAGAGVVALAVGVAGWALLLGPGSGKAGPTSPTSAGTDGSASMVVLAHQGGWETFPLETLPAFEAAAKAGATVETDLRWTSDGVPVLAHDARTASAEEAGPERPMVCQGGPYTVSQTRWSVLREKCRTVAAESKDGQSYPIPTLDEALKAIAAVPGAQIVVEVKPARPTATQIQDYLATFAKYDMAQRAVASSFYPDALAAIQAQAAKDALPLRFLLMLRPSQNRDLPTPEQLSDRGLWGVALRSDIATRGNVAGLQAKKLTVVVWTVDTVQQWGAVKQAAADLVLTNRPAAYRAWRP